MLGMDRVERLLEVEGLTISLNGNGMKSVERIEFVDAFYSEFDDDWYTSEDRGIWEENYTDYLIEIGDEFAQAGIYVPDDRVNDEIAFDQKRFYEWLNDEWERQDWAKVAVMLG